MAKLSAHKTEVARLIVKARESRDYHQDGRPVEFHYSYSFRSDGHILRRMSSPDFHQYGRASQDWGWKLWRKLKDPKRDTVARQLAYAERMRDRFDAAWTTPDSEIFDVVLIKSAVIG